jgi:ABC-2 type transport system ATP-binding protein
VGRAVVNIEPHSQRIAAMLVSIKSLQLSLGGVRILHDVHLSLGTGEIYGLLGPNGAGKSTTIAAALGLLVPEAGEVRLFEKNPLSEGAAIYARLGVLPEQNGFYNWMTADAYLGFFAALYGLNATAAELAGCLTNVGLAPRTGQRIATFSRGMRQRLGLARALVADPALLILDEPTNGLDPRGRREIHDVLLGLSRQGVGVLLCTHLLDDVDRLCHRIGVIVEGRTVAEGSIAELVRTTGHMARFRLRLAGEPSDAVNSHITVLAREGEWCVVELDPTVAPDTAWRDLMFRGWPIVEIRRDGGGLEDLYLSLAERKAA